MYLNFQNKCIRINELDLPFSFCTRISTGMQLSKNKSKIMFLIEEKGISGGICHSIHQYAGANSKQKDCNLNKESSYLMYWDVSNLYG